MNKILFQFQKVFRSIQHCLNWWRLFNCDLESLFSSFSWDTSKGIQLFIIPGTFLQTCCNFWSPSDWILQKYYVLVCGCNKKVKMLELLAFVEAVGSNAIRKYSLDI